MRHPMRKCAGCCHGIGCHGSHGFAPLHDGMRRPQNAAHSRARTIQSMAQVRGIIKLDQMVSRCMKAVEFGSQQVSNRV